MIWNDGYEGDDRKWKALYGYTREEYAARCDAMWERVKTSLEDQRKIDELLHDTLGTRTYEIEGD